MSTRTRPELLAACVIAASAGLNGIAEAVMLNPNGLGQVLLFPYYTTQGGNDTLISIVNTSERGKAVKVQLLEAANGRPVLDFHLYLGAHDVWTAGIGHLDAFGTGLITDDRSCTVPDIVRGGLGAIDLPSLPDGRYFAPFSDLAYTGLAQDHPDSLATILGSPQRLREGLIQVIEMADVEPNSPLEQWITHSQAGEPGDCQAVSAAWFDDDGEFVADPSFGLQAPDGGGVLYGNAMIVNPARGTMFGYSADALVGFNHRILHRRPSENEPGLHSVNGPGADGDTQVTAQVFVGSGMVEATYRADDEANPYGKIDAISALYMTQRVSNDYYVDESAQVDGSSEWVLSFPTRRYYVDSQPGLPDGDPFLSPVDSFRPPFSTGFGSLGSSHLLIASGYDRHQRWFGPSGGGFIRPPGLHCRTLATCWQTHALTINQADELTIALPSKILGSNNFFSVSIPFGTGWLNLGFPGEPALRASDEGVVFHGLPVTGFVVTNYDNEAAASGTLANYSALFRHRSVPSCSGDEACQ